jgi:hypothetical protein
MHRRPVGTSKIALKITLLKVADPELWATTNWPPRT